MPTTATPTPPDPIRAFLAAVPSECPYCRYDLRSTSGDRCTECGGRLVLRLQGLSFHRRWWWLPVALLLFGGVSYTGFAAREVWRFLDGSFSASVYPTLGIVALANWSIFGLTMLVAAVLLWRRGSRESLNWWTNPYLVAIGLHLADMVNLHAIWLAGLLTG
ncbi:MAG: hypothetical protein JNK25_00495 [Phycisphaerae bacterium]|nr:hypothetical protein [Phycisphaerae bacterium]